MVFILHHVSVEKMIESHFKLFSVDSGVAASFPDFSLVVTFSMLQGMKPGQRRGNQATSSVYLWEFCK